MVALEYCENLHIGFADRVDASLAALLSCGDAAVVSEVGGADAAAQTQPHGKLLLSALEQMTCDCAVVPFEDFAYFAWTRKSTNLRVLGCLLGGDTRVILELETARGCAAERVLGAASPLCASFRFQDLSYANNFDFPCISRSIPHDGVADAIWSQRFEFIEANAYSDGLAALKSGAAQRAFKVSDYGVPSSYSHVMVVHSQIGPSKKKQLLSLKKRLIEVYERILSDVDWAVHRLANNPDVSQLSGDESQSRAALRVLSPHMLRALRSECSLTWEELEPFYRWLHLKTAQLSDLRDTGTPVQLDHLICDFWREC